MNELLMAVSALALIGSVIGIGWHRIFIHGKTKRRNEDLEKEIADIRNEKKQSHEADLTDDQHDQFVDSL